MQIWEICLKETLPSDRNPSLGGTPAFMMRYDKLDSHEVKDLVICFLYIVKNLSEG